MKTARALLAAVIALAALSMSFGNLAFAQSDRTLGINCTVAGHQHCGENGGYWDTATGIGTIADRIVVAKQPRETERVPARERDAPQSPALASQALKGEWHTQHSRAAYGNARGDLGFNGQRTTKSRPKKIGAAAEDNQAQSAL